MKYISAIAVIFCLITTAVWAVAPPYRINYQGVLRDASNNPLDGDVQMVFRFYTAATAGTLLWAEQYDVSLYPPAVTVTNGLFSVDLGDPAHYIGGAMTDFAAVFSQNTAVYLSVEIESDTEMVPRTKVISAAYSLNADTLDGLESTFFARSTHSHDTRYLRKDINDTAVGRISFTAAPTGSGTSSATVGISPSSLTVNQTLFGIENLTSDVFTIDGEGDVAVRGTMGLNGSLHMDTDGPEGNQNVYFYNSGSMTGEYFGWDETNARFFLSDSLELSNLYLNNMYPTNIFANGTALSINFDGPDSDAAVYFYNNGSYNTEYLRWSEVNDGFILSDDLSLAGTIRTGTTAAAGPHNHFGGTGVPTFASVNTSSDVYVASDLELDGALALNGTMYVDDNGPDGDQYLYFYEGGSNTGEYLRWNNASDRYHFSAGLDIDGLLALDGKIYMDDTQLYLNYDGPDGDQTVFFYDNSVNMSEYFRWSDTYSRFILSDGLNLAGALRTGTASSTLNYNHFGTSGTPSSLVITTVDDVFINNDLEIDGVACLNGSLYMKDNGPDSNQTIFFFNNGLNFNEYLRWNDSINRFGLSDGLNLAGTIRIGSVDSNLNYNHFGTSGSPSSGVITTDNDVYVNGDLEVDGTPYFSGNMVMNEDGPEGDQAIFFYENGANNTEYLSWKDGENAFAISDDLAVDGALFVNYYNLYLNYDGPDGNQNIYFYNNGASAQESLGWRDSDSSFFLSDDIEIDGGLEVDGIVNTGDLNTSGIASLNGTLYMDLNGAPEQTIYFYDDGHPANEYFGWVDFYDRFELTNDLYIKESNLDVGGNRLYLNYDGLSTSSYVHFGPMKLEYSTPLSTFLLTDDLEINGDIIASGTKSFIQNHPYDETVSVVYIALEGDEAGTYTRGSAQLNEGYIRIPLSESFSFVTNPDIGLTAHITPRGDSQGLYVESITTEELIVRESNGGKSDVAFDFIVFGLRIGYEQKPVYQPKEHESQVPSTVYWQNYFDRHPTLQTSTPLERYTRMMQAMNKELSLDTTESEHLKQAIGQYNSDDEKPGPSGPDREEPQPLKKSE